MKLRDFSKLYFTFLVFHLAVLYKEDTGVLFYISKPLLLFSLLVYFISLTSETEGLKKWIIAALASSLIGDILLMQEGNAFFLGGMGAFAIAQLCYIVFFINQRQSIKIAPLLIVVPLALAGLFILNFIIGLPSHLTIAVNIYGFLLITNLWAGINFQMSNKLPFFTISIGLLLFFVSDLLLANGLFNNQEIWQKMAVMLTYGLAQYLIIVGVLKSYKIL